MKDLWTIHGQQYDLSDFVDHHPGGKESILLGRGRDCTSMFESYHPFTNAHRAVLKKYQKHNTSPCIASSDWDPFYSVLKTRVQKTLEEHGIDPKQDRAAPPHRILYYLFVVGCMVVAAFYHIKVRILIACMHRLLCRTFCLFSFFNKLPVMRLPALTISFLCAFSSISSLYVL